MKYISYLINLIAIEIISLLSNRIYLEFKWSFLLDFPTLVNKAVSIPVLQAGKLFIILKPFCFCKQIFLRISHSFSLPLISPRVITINGVLNIFEHLLLLYINSVQIQQDLTEISKLTCYQWSLRYRAPQTEGYAWLRWRWVCVSQPQRQVPEKQLACPGLKSSGELLPNSNSPNGHYGNFKSGRQRRVGTNPSS